VYSSGSVEQLQVQMIRIYWVATTKLGMIEEAERMAQKGIEKAGDARERERESFPFLSNLIRIRVRR